VIAPSLRLTACLLLAGGLCTVWLLPPSPLAAPAAGIPAGLTPGVPILRDNLRSVLRDGVPPGQQDWVKQGGEVDETMVGMQQDPAAVLRWIAREASTVKRTQLLASFLTGLAETDPAYAAALCRELLPAGDERQSAMEAIAGVWLKQDAPAAASWALGLNDAERTGPISVVLYAWRAEEPAALRAWVRGIPVVQDRDWILSRLVGWQIESNPADAGVLLREISDPAIRDRAAAGLVRDWARADFEAALTWTLSLNPPSLRSHMFAQMALAADEPLDPWR
jgi:hypothetical protein